MEVPIIFNDAKSGSRKLNVKLLIEEEYSDQNAGKRIRILLTDPVDPLFFYSLTLTESDFHSLKKQQGLLVDFSNFVPMVKQLVDKCVQEAQCSPDSPKFRLVLETECNTDAFGGGFPDSSAGKGGTLSFQEVNPFRHLCHLSLKVCKGNDSQVKEYLAECIRKIQSESEKSIASLRAKVEDLTSELDRTKSQLGDANVELSRWKTMADDKCAKLNAQMAQDIANEKERSMKAINDLQDRFDQERRQTAEAHSRAVRQMENRIAALDYENKDLTERKHRSEGTIQRLNEQVKQLQEETTRLKTEVAAKRNEHHKLDTDYNMKERAISQLQTKLTLTEQENLRLQAEVAKQKELYALANEQKTRLETDLREKCALVQKRETAVKNVSQELLKANEIIKKFQSQVFSEHSKVKKQTKTLEEQEKLMAQKNEEINSLREDLKISSEKLSAANVSKDEFEGKCKKLQEEIESLEKKLKTNETVINWLNRQLTTAQTRDPGFRVAPPPEGVATFTPSGIGAASTPIDPQGSRRPNTIGRSKNAEDESVQFGAKSRFDNNEKENSNGLSAKYLRPPTETPQQSVLPSNVKTKGLLRKQSALGSRNNLPSPQVDSVYFPRT